MLVTRISIRAPIVSFRYPHFLVGRQPTYRMPPLSTLYGHICSAAGEWLPPRDLQIGILCRAAAMVDDLEHQVIATRSGGFVEKQRYPGVRKTLDGTVQPTLRQCLFDVRATLYVAGDWLSIFRAPRYTVVLGRSQDLASYQSVSLVELVESETAFYQDTLLPWSLRPHVQRATAELMPRFIDYNRMRQTTFDRFLVVREPVSSADPNDWLAGPDSPPRHLVDPELPLYRSAGRGVWMHSLVP